jgi:hypothetical protein
LLFLDKNTIGFTSQFYKDISFTIYFFLFGNYFVTEFVLESYEMVRIADELRVNIALGLRAQGKCLSDVAKVHRF